MTNFTNLSLISFASDFPVTCVVPTLLNLKLTPSNDTVLLSPLYTWVSPAPLVISTCAFWPTTFLVVVAPLLLVYEMSNFCDCPVVLLEMVIPPENSLYLAVIVVIPHFVKASFIALIFSVLIWDSLLSLVSILVKSTSTSFPFTEIFKFLRLSNSASVIFSFAGWANCLTFIE